MNITFLIGNGFDLNLGLKTGYKDVLKEYLQEKNKDERVTKFKQKIDENFENWSDFEKQLGIYTNDFYEWLKATSMEVEDFILCFNDFRKFLIKYLKKEQEKIVYGNLVHENFKRSIDNFIDDLNGYSKMDIRNLINSKKIDFKFISFNYTEVLDKCIGPLYNLVHVHGSINRNPLIGVDNVNQIKYEDFRDKDDILLNIVKTEMNKRGDKNDKIAKEMIDDSNIICLFGLSLGETDITWWKNIGKWLGILDNRHLIIYKYVDNFDSINSGQNIKDKEETINHFCTIAELLEDNKKIIDRIHIVTNTNLFKINLSEKKF